MQNTFGQDVPGPPPPPPQGLVRERPFGAASATVLPAGLKLTHTAQRRGKRVVSAGPLEFLPTIRVRVEYSKKEGWEVGKTIRKKKNRVCSVKMTSV